MIERDKEGKIISIAPGIYPDINFKDYLSIKAVSNSYLGRLDQCPAAALIEPEDTQPMRVGRATHALVLEGQEAFDESFAVAPECDKRTKVGKALYADFVLDNPSKEYITTGEYEIIKNMRIAVHKHPAAVKVLAEGLREQTVIWKDKSTGLLCKSRPDQSPNPNTKILVDLKTAESADSRLWFNKAHKFGNFRQSGFYLDGRNAQIEDPDKHFTEFVFVVVEKKAPFRVEVYGVDADMDDSMILWGREEYKRIMRIEVQCRKNEFYPHYQDPGIQMLYRPNWLK